ncbi:TRAP transporter large permease [Halarsenatibacter silvermanii]|uniref:TRAP transporter, DctM subunit n=1 Tax=Halarsenatibacter silvermanii TaxID=321763 RepID=A0A1G9SFJ0_9FIRM|nr:TRAP transporter large permease [Halarsenatibacter silvermanii]SDM34248.1 TRAP transporter, DctM subunit [Halarsenatibacter silvermanii]
MTVLGLFLLFLFIFTFMGVPIVFSLTISNILLIIWLDFPLDIIATEAISGINEFSLLAVPFFIFVGKIMNAGGIAQKLVDFADALVGFITGGLGHVNVLASMFFGGVSASAIADTAAIGGIMIPQMVRENYSPEYSGGITASSAVIGIIIPPSIPFILYGITTGTSISQLFVGGIIPGIMVGFALMTTNYILSKKNRFGKASEQRKFNIKKVLKSFKIAFFPLLLPFVIVFGILSGIFTATEAGAIASFLGFILSAFVYREVGIRGLIDIIIETGETSAVVIIIAAMASVTAYLLTISGVPHSMAEFIGGNVETRIALLLMTNILLLFTGAILDLTPAILIFAPILAPVMREFGISTVYFGVIMGMNLGIGLITPPVGTVLYVACGVADVEMEKLVKSTIPFLFVLIAVLLTLVFFPQIVMFLPSMMQ